MATYDNNKDENNYQTACLHKHILNKKNGSCIIHLEHVEKQPIHNYPVLRLSIADRFFFFFLSALL